MSTFSYRPLARRLRLTGQYLRTGGARTSKQESTPEHERTHGSSLQEWLRTLAVLLTPVAVAFVGARYAASNSERDSAARLIGLAIEVLRAPPSDSARPLRGWAVAVVNRYSEVKLSTSLGNLLRDSLSLTAFIELSPSEQMRAAIDRTNAIVADMLRANDDRLLLAQGRMKALPFDSVRRIVAGTNRVQDQYRRQRELAELSTSLAFAKFPSVVDAFSRSRLALEAYTECAESTYLSAQKRIAPANSCARERDSAFGSTGDLRAKFLQAYLASIHGGS
jgi:hypothetical protein